MLVSAILLVVLTVLVPPVGVLLVSECGADFLINLCLTLLGYLPGLIHALYIEYVYYKRREETAERGTPAPVVYSDNVLRGGHAAGYGTIRTTEDV